MRATTARDQAGVARTFARLIELEKQLGADAPPMLRHYLERRSYQKALEFLSSEQPAAGTCR